MQASAEWNAATCAVIPIDPTPPLPHLMGHDHPASPPTTTHHPTPPQNADYYCAQTCGRCSGEW